MFPGLSFFFGPRLFLGLRPGLGFRLSFGFNLFGVDAGDKGMMRPKPVVAVGDFWRSTTETLAGEEILSSRPKAEFNISKCSQLIIFAADAQDAVKKMLAKIG